MEQSDVLEELRRRVLPDVLTVEDLSAHLRCSPATVRAILRRGEIAGRRLGGRWLVSRQALVQALTGERERISLRVVPEGDER